MLLQIKELLTWRLLTWVFIFINHLNALWLRLCVQCCLNAWQRLMRWRWGEIQKIDLQTEGLWVPQAVCMCFSWRNDIVTFMDVCLLRMAVCTMWEVGLTVFRWECTRENCWLMWFSILPYTLASIVWLGTLYSFLNQNSESFSLLSSVVTVSCSHDFRSTCTPCLFKIHFFFCRHNKKWLLAEISSETNT